MIKSKSAKVGDWCFILVCVLVSLICVVPILMAERSESGGVRYGAWRYEIYQGIFLDGISDAGLYRCVADDDDALCVSSDF